MYMKFHKHLAKIAKAAQFYSIFRIHSHSKVKVLE